MFNLAGRGDAEAHRENGRPHAARSEEVPAVFYDVAARMALAKVGGYDEPPKFVFAFRSGPVLTYPRYPRTIRSGPRESLARNQAWRAAS